MFELHDLWEHGDNQASLNVNGVIMSGIRLWKCAYAYDVDGGAGVMSDK
jgi:hypothetical protein